jgi:hypothetical protein
MEITYRSVSGPACILSEQKADADLTDYQLAGYPGWVRDKLVLVAPDTEKYRLATQFDSHISWLRIAQEMHRIAARRGQSAWREKALLPEEPSVLRFLHEVLSFIERQDVGVSGMDPIDGKVIDAYRRVESVRGTLLTFLRMIHADERIRALEPTAIGSAKHDTYWWFSLERPDWPFWKSLDCDSGFEICLQPEADFLDEEGTEPILSAGFSFYPANGTVPEVLVARDSVVATALKDLGAKIPPGERAQHPHRASLNREPEPPLITTLVANRSLRERVQAKEPLQLNRRVRRREPAKTRDLLLRRELDRQGRRAYATATKPDDVGAARSQS